MSFSPKRMGNLAYSLVMFVIVSVLAGVLVAGLFVPFAGLAGLGGNAAASQLGALPTELSTPTPSTPSRIKLANGDTLATFYEENRRPVKLNQVAPIMRQAQIAIEDNRFYEHGALDVKGTLRALVKNTANEGNIQGGSSISQQYVKMVQVSGCHLNIPCIEEAKAPTTERKIRELRYAIALEKKFSKDEILERYLNIAYYGDGAYGIESAARHFFDTKASKLNLAQAAMLAGLVQNPDANNPVANLSAAIDRRDVVLNRMVELKLVTPDQSRKAKKTTFDEDLVQNVRNGCPGTRYPFLCDYVRRTLMTLPSMGKTPLDRKNMLNRGGLTIETGIDTKTQDIAQKAVSKVVGAKDPLISTMNMIEPKTGLIIASAQSRPEMGTNKKKGQSYYNYSVERSLGGAEGYQAGSTFKAFTAAAALEKGIPLSKKYNARSPMDFGDKTFSTCIGPTRDRKYKPKNSTGTNGRMDMMKAAARSVNTYFLQLEQTVGICPTTKMAKKLGVQLADESLDITKDPASQVISFTLGISNVTPMSMAGAYATFAAGGIHCDPIIISKVTGRTGKKLDIPDANCKRVISKDVANGMNKLLGNVMVGNGTGTRARIPNIKHQAGKTGTINSNQAVWFNGYTAKIAGSAMIAIDPTRKIWRSGYHKRAGVFGYKVPSTGAGLEGSGSGDAGVKIWQPAMTAAMKGRKDVAFKAPPKSIVSGKRVTMPYIWGMGLSAAKKKLRKAGFTVDTEYRYSSRCNGCFIGWSPNPGSSIEKFGTVYQLVSKGEDPNKKRREAAEKKAKAEKKAAEKAAQKREKAAEEAQQRAFEELEGR